MPKYQCQVIVCGPAIGKTYLSKTDSRFVDIDGLKADYKYNITDLSLEEKERGKLNRGKVIKEDSTAYAIKLLEETIKANKIALISYQEKILEYIIKNNIPYCLVYADISSREEYIKRMIERGNTEEFINEVKKNNNEYITGLYKVGRYGWILDDIKILKEKIPAKGKLGIWNYESEDL